MGNYFVRAHADGVVHAQVSFDPQAHTSRGMEEFVNCNASKMSHNSLFADSLMATLPPPVTATMRAYFSGYMLDN